MNNFKNLNDESIMGWMIGDTYVFNPNWDEIDDSRLKTIMINNPPTIRRCKGHLFVRGTLSINIASMIVDILENEGCIARVGYDVDSDDDEYFVEYASKTTHSKKQVEQILTSNFAFIFQTINLCLFMELEKSALEFSSFMLELTKLIEEEIKKYN